MQIFNTGSVASAHMKRTCTKCISKVLMQLQSNQLQPSTMQLLVQGHLSTGVQGWSVVTCSSNSGFCTYDHSLCKYFREWTLGFYFWNHLSLKKNTGYLQAGSWDVKFRVGLSCCCCEIWCKKYIYIFEVILNPLKSNTFHFQQFKNKTFIFHYVIQMAWMLFSSAGMAQTVDCNDHHFKIQYYTAPSVQTMILYRGWCFLQYYDHA